MMNVKSTKNMAKYIEQHKDQIQREQNRLTNLGYDGDLHDKMFKSGRYYYRNKPVTKLKPKERRKYISLENNILQSVYRYIHDQGLSLKPAEGYKQYIEINKELIKAEINRLKENTDLSKKYFVKNKKSYKNKHFNMREKDNNNI